MPPVQQSVGGKASIFFQPSCLQSITLVLVNGPDHKGPGKGNLSTNNFMRELNRKVSKHLGKDYVEQSICGETKQTVDFFIPEEKTIIEVELSLYNVHTNLDRDIFKALLARDAGHRVKTLLLMGKEGSVERHARGASRAVIDWIYQHHKLRVEIQDIKPVR